jgi:alcohol dehydrogenase (NADP+)
MAEKYRFQGWLGHDKNSIGAMKWQDFEPKPWEETDIDIKITHCGFEALVPPYYCSLADQDLVSVHQTFILFDPVGVQRITLFVSATKLLVRPLKLAKMCPPASRLEIELVLAPSRVRATTRTATASPVLTGKQSYQNGKRTNTDSSSMEHTCKISTDTYNSKWPDGSKSYGGYADYWRGKYSFVMKIPDEIPSDQAAPMLCGGITGTVTLYTDV